MKCTKLPGLALGRFRLRNNPPPLSIGLSGSPETRSLPSELPRRGAVTSTSRASNPRNLCSDPRCANRAEALLYCNS